MELLQQIVNGLMLGGILAFVAVAFTLTIGMLNFLNFTIPAQGRTSAASAGTGCRPRWPASPPRCWPRC
jgi:branched-chain amino acid transport system permease protein